MRLPVRFLPVRKSPEKVDRRTWMPDLFNVGTATVEIRIDLEFSRLGIYIHESNTVFSDLTTIDIKPDGDVAELLFGPASEQILSDFDSPASQESNRVSDRVLRLASSKRWIYLKSRRRESGLFDWVCFDYTDRYDETLNAEIQALARCRPPRRC